MDYTTFQSIILIKNILDNNHEQRILKRIQEIIEEYAEEIKVIKQDTKLAYEIDGYEKAKLIAIEFKIKSIGAKKRIGIIEQKLNTLDDIICFMILEKNQIIDYEVDDNCIYIVYEFDYGSSSEGIEPRITIFGGFKNRSKAIEQAEELLKEGLERYFLDASFVNETNPFLNHNEIHLFEEKTEDKQTQSVYYIKIEKININ